MMMIMSGLEVMGMVFMFWRINFTSTFLPKLMHRENIILVKLEVFLLIAAVFGWAIGRMVCLELPEVKQN